VLHGLTLFIREHEAKNRMFGAAAPVDDGDHHFDEDEFPENTLTVH
jgi:hypothetical protein